MPRQTGKKKPALVEALETLRENLGESVHVAFRKGADGDEAQNVWRAIRSLPPEQWDGALAFMLYCMDFDRILRLAKRATAPPPKPRRRP